MVLDRAGIYHSHPLSTPWFAPNLRRPTVYHIHTQQGQQNRDKANSIGRRPTVYREKANSIGRRPALQGEGHPVAAGGGGQGGAIAPGRRDKGGAC